MSSNLSFLFIIILLLTIVFYHFTRNYIIEKTPHKEWFKYSAAAIHIINLPKTNDVFCINDFSLRFVSASQDIVFKNI